MIGFLGWCPNINPAWWWEQCEGWLIWPYYVFPVIRWPGFVIITPSFSPLVPFSVIRSLEIVAVPWMLDLWSSCKTFCGNGLQDEYYVLDITFATVLPWFINTILFNVQRSLSLSFGLLPLFLLAEDVFPWFVYAILTLETAALDTPNQVAASLQIFLLNVHQ